MTTAPRAQLLTALAAPTLLGAIGVHGLGSLPATFLLYAAGGCVLVPWLLLGGRFPAGRGGLPFSTKMARAWRGELALAVLFGPVFLVIYAAVRPWLGPISDYRTRAAALGLDLGEPFAWLLLFAVFNPWLEEWWWRGQATPRCCAAFGRGPGLALVTGAFAAWHMVLLGALFPWPLMLARVVLIAAASLLWSHLALARGSWRATWVAHLAADLAMVALFVLVVMPR
ncbi:MAG: CPBP family intramembrane metalloprotease [bacterium]|nr:CPBP family intramembrane metalloprotease [bacterium]